MENEKTNIEVSELSKYFPTEFVTVKRSQIHFADYNPRKISAENRKLLKRSIKKFGVVGGIIVNKRTGYTIVGGHQKVDILDEMKKYPENDYELKIELVDVDEVTEMELNVALNNPNLTGTYDFDKLASIVPDINYKNAGLLEADLSMIGLDYIYKTEQQNSLSNELEEMMQPVVQERESIKEANRQAREIARAEEERQRAAEAEALAQQEMTREERVKHMKDVKAQVRQQAMENAQNMDAYVVLSFDDFKAKAEFCQRFGFNPMERMIKGEEFDARCEVVMNDEDYEDDEE